MRRYEMMVIVSDALEEDAAKALVERIERVVGERGGNVLATDWWGKRELAYEIDHRGHGWYVVFDLQMPYDGLAELERLLKISDDVVRFKTVRPDLRVHASA